MTTRICFGIPHRVGACACEIGKDREASGVVEMTETSTSWDNCVANKPRDSGNAIYSISYTDPTPGDGKNDGVSALAASISCWSTYGAAAPGDPKLIHKTKGDVAAGVGGSFPSIQITLRPLKTVLNYEYAGNLNDSGQGEVGYESANGAQDVISANYWEGANTIPLNFVEGSFDPNPQINAYVDNLSDFEYYITDVMQGGAMVTLAETHYFKSADRPGDEPTPWQPLTGLELDPTFHPRLPSMESYAFGRNESYDYRYRFPANYLTKYGSLTMPENTFLVRLPAVPEANIDEIPQGQWTWQTLSQIDPSFQPPLNPVFQPDNNDIYINDDWIKEGVAPVIKGWYWDSSTPPTNGLKGLFQSTSFKMLKEVRKRYPFSFAVNHTRTEVYSVVDHKEGNQMLYEDSEAPGNSYLRREPAFYSKNVETSNSFKAIAWWRMEVNAELCGWNSKKTVSVDAETQQQTTTIAGATIKGHIKLGIKILQPSYSEQGLYSQLYTLSYGQNFWDRFCGIAPSFVYRCKVETYFDEDFIQRYEVLEYDGGTIPWQVTLDEDNAKGMPIKFLDFPITSEAELPGENPPPPGTVPENSLVFIKDFVVTEVILP
jgi:hypothetical protein